jgi:nucleoside-diphosphate-sugar epimerase
MSINKSLIHIIGKRSNLTQAILKLSSASEVYSAIDILSNKSIKFDKYSKNIVVINSFYPAKNLKNIESFNAFLDASLKVLIKILEQVKRNKSLHIKVIYISSASIYGNIPLGEESIAPCPASIHSTAKLLAERIVIRECESLSKQYIIFRVTNIFGGTDNFSVVYKLLKSINSGKKFKVFNNGVSKNDFIHVNDAAEDIISLSNYDENIILNLGSGFQRSILEMINSLETCGQVSLNLDYLTILEDDQIDISIKRKNEILGFRREYIDVVDYVYKKSSHIY